MPTARLPLSSFSFATLVLCNIIEFVPKKRRAQIEFVPKKRRVQKGKKHKEIIIGTILFSLLAICGILFYRNFLISFLDTSLNGSEKKTQLFVPVDVKREIEQQRKLYKLTELPTLRVPILMYHYVEFQDPNDKVRASLTTSPYTLDLQIKTLKDAGYTFLTASELADILEAKSTPPKKPILLTFDDGYRDFYTYAYPILKKYNVKATQYVITGYLNNPNHLTIFQLQELAKDSLIEIGAHTVTHDWLKGKSVQEVGYQVSESKKVLEKLTGKKIVSFAYPYGAFDLSAAKVVEATGFTNSVSTVPGIIQSHENLFFLYRLRPGARGGENFLSWLSESKFKPY